MTGMIGPRTFAEQLFEAVGLLGILDEQLTNRLLCILGIEPDDTDSWPFCDVTHDWHDHSFELKGARVGLVFSEAQQSQLWALGFFKCWICFSDGSEHIYYRSGGGPFIHGKPVLCQPQTN